MNNALMNGPLTKSVSTNMFELMVRIGLYAPNQISYSVDNGVQALIGNQFSIDFSATLSKTNLTHVAFNAKDSAKFMTQNCDPVFNHVAVNNHQKIHDLTKGENYAIKDYTGSAYYPINSFLYKHNDITKTELNDIFWIPNPTPNLISQKMNSLIAKTAFTASGLNKIMPTPEEVKTFRGHKQLSNKELKFIQQQVDKTGEYLLDVDAFLSTSKSENVANWFTWKTVFVFSDDYGKSVDKISHFPGEQECLITPGQKIQITGYEKHGDKIKLFAKIVEPLDPTTEIPTEKEWQDFVDLVNWSKAHNIPTNDIDPHTQCLLDKATVDHLSYQDIFSDTNVIPLDNGPEVQHQNITIGPVVPAPAPDVQTALPAIQQDAIIIA